MTHEGNNAHSRDNHYLILARFGKLLQQASGDVPNWRSKSNSRFCEFFINKLLAFICVSFLGFTPKLTTNSY